MGNRSGIEKNICWLFLSRVILHELSEIWSSDYRKSTPEEEAKGIDGYVGITPILIKPMTYKSKKGLPEEIEVRIVFYDKIKEGIMIEY